MDLDLRDGTASLAAGVCPSSFTGNGRIAVAYNDPCNVPGSEWVVGGGYYTTGDLRTVNGVTFQKFLQGFVVLNDAGPQISSAGCFRDAVTHGLGHALGLGHSDSTTSIMQAAPPGNCASGPRGLGADDTAGITAIYEGIPSGANPPNTPTAFTVTSALSTVTMNWTPASTGGQAQRFLIDAGTAPGNYNLGTILVNAPATTFSAGPAGLGVYYLRLRAQNAIGTSTPTPERSVNVGNCTAPPAPASFTASSTDTFVNLQWTPPASGVVQGYQVVAGSAPGLANLAVLPYPGHGDLARRARALRHLLRARACDQCLRPESAVERSGPRCAAMRGAARGADRPGRIADRRHRTARLDAAGGHRAHELHHRGGQRPGSQRHPRLPHRVDDPGSRGPGAARDLLRARHRHQSLRPERSLE